MARNRRRTLFVTVGMATVDTPTDGIAASIVPGEVRNLIEAGWEVLVVSPDGVEMGRYEVIDGEARIAWNTP